MLLLVKENLKVKKYCLKFKFIKVFKILSCYIFGEIFVFENTEAFMEYFCIRVVKVLCKRVWFFKILFLFFKIF